MRDLVRAEAAESERLRTLSPVIVDEMWASGLMSGVQPEGGRRRRAVVSGDDRHLDRNGLAGRLFRLDRHCQPAVDVRRRDVSSRRGLRRDVHRERQPHHHRRPVLSQRSGFGGRRWLPIERRMEFRLRHRTLGIHRRRLLPDGRRRDALGQRGNSGYAGGISAARRGHLHRWMACPGAQGNRLLRLQRRRRLRAGVPNHSAVHPRARRGGVRRPAGWV